MGRVAVAKDGRPQRRMAAIHALGAQTDLAERFPQVVSMIRAVLTENLTRTQLEAAFEAAVDEVSKQPDRISAIIDDTGLEAGLLTLTYALQAAMQDLSLLRRLVASIAGTVNLAEVHVANLKDLLWDATVQRPAIDSHVVATANALLAAGLTTTVSRRISVSQVDRIAAILSEDTVARQSLIPAKIGTSLSSVAWRTDNPWTKIIQDIPGYQLSTRTVSNNDTGSKALVDAGLPPYADLKQFGLSFALQAFEAATTNGARATQCWKLLQQWLRDNNVAGSRDEGVAIRRKTSWVFLFSLVYRFNEAERQFNKVQFPSPLDPNEVIVATRC